MKKEKENVDRSYKLETENGMERERRNSGGGSSRVKVKMSSTSLLTPINGGHRSFSLSHHRLSATHPTPSKWGWRRYQGGNIVAYGTNGSALQMLPNPNASSKGNNEVIMVDPSEAKRLAAKQMEQIKAKENFKRKRQIEAINGAWAMIGVTAGLVLEGQTGKSIPVQLADYWSAIVDFFML